MTHDEEYIKILTEKGLRNNRTLSFHYTLPYGTVELKAGITEDGWLRFSVRDTGAGIPPEEQEMVFDKFHQVTKSDTLEDKPKGTGLGLTICKQIIEYHGGRIWVEAETDIGSEFIFILPPEGQNTLRAETLDENA